MPVDGSATPYIGIYTLDLFCDQLHDPRVETTFSGHVLRLLRQGEKSGLAYQSRHQYSDLPYLHKTHEDRGA
jgi:hypothetical protein